MLKKTSSKQLIETMTRTINSLLNGDTNNELSLVCREDCKTDELYELANSIKALNDKLKKDKESASDSSPGSINNLVDLKEKTPQPGAYHNEHIPAENRPGKLNAISEESNIDLFREMDKAFALFEIVYDDKGKPSDYIFSEINKISETETASRYNDVLGKSIRTVFPGISELWIDTCNNVSTDGETRTIEYYSEELKCYVNLIAFRTTQGKLATITTDISEWKTIEKRLKLYRNVVQSISDYVSITDLNDNIIFVNNAFMNAYGYEEKELLGKSILIVRPDKVPGEKNNEILPDTLSSGGWSGSLWNKKKNGTNFYIRLSTSIVKDGHNNPIALVGIAKDTTAQKLIRDSLKNYVSLLNATLNSTVNGIVAINLEGKIVIYNEQLLKMWSIPREKFTKNNNNFLLKYFFSMVKSKENYDSKLNDLLLNLEDSSFDIIDLKDGRTFEMFSQPQFIDNKPVGRVWSFHDITTHQRMNKELLESSTKLSLAMDLAKLAHWEYDSSSNLFTFNDEFYELYGTSVEKEGSYFMSTEEYTQKFVFADDAGSIKESIRKTLGTNDSNYHSRMEHRIIRADGQVRKIVVRSAVIQNELGKPIKIYGANQDVTESRKIIEDLLNSEAKYRKIFEFIKDVYYETNSEGIITEISPSIQKLSGFTQAELIGQHSGLHYICPTERKKYVDEVMSKGFVTDYELAMKDKNGNPLYVSVSSHVKLNEKGEFEGIEGSMRDISERKANEEEIKRINKELVELNATKDKFFSIIAHDLKSPFQGILGYTDILLNEFKTLDDDEKIEFVHSVYNLTQGAYKLLENLLHWARLQTGNIIFNTDFFNLSEALKPQIYLMQESAKKKNIIVKSSIDRKIFVIADLDMLQTIVRNLISNSIKFTNPGGEISVTAEDLNDNIKICVEDTGVGMSKENIQKLFRIEKSFSTKGTEKEEGTGLGLLLCKEMVDMHKGEIWAESEPGKGTKMFITIPSDNNS
jgi:PAS domain S-box-containing protein